MAGPDLGRCAEPWALASQGSSAGMSLLCFLLKHSGTHGGKKALCTQVYHHQQGDLCLKTLL